MAGPRRGRGATCRRAVGLGPFGFSLSSPPAPGPWSPALRQVAGGAAKCASTRGRGRAGGRAPRQGRRQKASCRARPRRRNTRPRANSPRRAAPAAAHPPRPPRQARPACPARTRGRCPHRSAPVAPCGARCPRRRGPWGPSCRARRWARRRRAGRCRGTAAGCGRRGMPATARACAREGRGAAPRGAASRGRGRGRGRGRRTRLLPASHPATPPQCPPPPLAPASRLVAWLMGGASLLFGTPWRPPPPCEAALPWPSAPCFVARIKTQA
jgi:hypothetical protein